MSCRLCGGATAAWFADDWRGYWRCGRCGYVQVPQQQQLSVEAEREYYGTHRNAVDDPGYRAWLGRLARPLLERVRPPASGLDFGCGPAPALAALLSEAGLEVALHDLYFAPRPEVFAREWDFITATEVLEHLRTPAAELQQLWECLRPGGWLALMTRRLPADPAAFPAWHYRRDPTHIGFFADASFAWLAQHWEARLELLDDDVALLRKA